MGMGMIKICGAVMIFDSSLSCTFKRFQERESYAPLLK